jgi:hypothetical protein
MTEKGSDPALPDGLFTAALETIGREIIDGWHADLPLDPCSARGLRSLEVEILDT